MTTAASRIPNRYAIGSRDRSIGAVNAARSSSFASRPLALASLTTGDWSAFEVALASPVTVTTNGCLHFAHFARFPTALSGTVYFARQWLQVVTVGMAGVRAESTNEEEHPTAMIVS